MIKCHLLTLISTGSPFLLWEELFHFIKRERELFLGIAPWVAI